MNAFDIFRYKKAGMSNLGVIKLLKFYRQHDKKVGLRQLAQIAQVKSVSDFCERYKTQDILVLKKIFNEFPNISILDDIYPIRLREIYNPPVLLFYKGNLDLLKKQKIAFVGSREATQDGIQAVNKLIKELDNQFVIVSGLARGIDSTSHISSIKNGGETIAVIGTGLDIYYPLRNKTLQEYISKNHLILTEYESGERALKFHFPERNRIIAGLSRGIVVVEAKIRSGSLITAERAMEEGRDVFAVPGSISKGNSDGCNHLIQQGAKLVFTGNDILEDYQVFL